MPSLCPSCGKNISRNDALERCPHCAAAFPREAQSRSTSDSHDSQIEDRRSSQTSTGVELAPDHWMAYVPKEVLEHTPLEGAAYFRRLDQSPSTATTITEEQTNTELEFSDREREEAHRKLLRSKGLVLDVDSSGFRLRSMATRSNAAQSDLSPYEIVRLASEFEGGVVPVEERIICPQCEAVVSPYDKTCQWCRALLK